VRQNEHRERVPAVSGREGRLVSLPALIASLPDKLRAAQETFSKTGGLHASGLFDLEGNLLVLREDVGRHNALDKILGHALMHGLLPLDQHILLVSGRVSFEIIQKALAAGIPLVAAISAPSSLAVEFAQEANQTLVGFPAGRNDECLHAGPGSIDQELVERRVSIGTQE
jgi:formate dehydrogenase accessory protein FdhD